MTVRVIFGIAAVTLLAGCGGTHSAGVKGAAKQVCAEGSTQPVGGGNVAWAAVVRKPLTAFREPGRDAISRFGLLNVNRVNTVFGVLAERVNSSCRATWLHVQLPMRPNGRTGWVRADHVQQLPVRTRIVVDLSQRVVRFYKNGRLVLHTPAAIGSSATPTPLGRYYVNQRLIPSDPGGPFGPGAIGISAFSPVLTGWAQGGPVAIHGTNEPWSIGRAVSNGCIRVPNATQKKLFAATLGGTPVVIHE